MLFEVFSPLFNQTFFWEFIDIAKVSAPVWIPVLLGAVFFEVWISLKQREWVASQGSVLLEIKLPREQMKSPVAMEMFLNHLNQGGVGTLLDVYLKGRVRTWFSLELVSIGGAVKFYIWMHKSHRTRVEAQLYAQFPNIEIHEVEDYAMKVDHNPEKWKFGKLLQFTLTKPDAYPIKTYVDYGLDKDPKEEYKNDPIVSVIEYLGSLKAGEQAWIQILVRSHAKEGLKLGRIFVKPDWKKAVESEVKKILKEARFKVDEEKAPSGQHMSEGQKDVVRAIERTTGKIAFDTMIRAFYFAEKDSFNGASIGGLIGTMTQYNSASLNGFRPDFSADYDYPWQDPFGKKRLSNERKLLEAYKRRSFFAPPFRNFKGKPFILTTEELATIFHFPGEVAATPSLSRIPSKKAEAPSNLPI